MPVMEVSLVQSYAGQEVINRWHYVASGTPAAVSFSFAMISAMGMLSSQVVSTAFPSGTVGRALQLLQVASLTYVSIAARDLYSDTDFYENPYAAPVVGATGGEGASPAIAYGFQTNRVKLSVRRGTKRVAGVSETFMGASGVLTSGGLTAANDLAAAMSDTLTYDDEGNTLTFVPAVLSYERVVLPGGSVVYRKYATEAEQITNSAQGVLWSPYTTVRTQTSRQYGRGT